MADKAIYSVDTVTSMSGTDKVYVNTGNNIKQITKDNLCGNDIKGINNQVETLKTEVNNNTNAISEVNDSLSVLGKCKNLLKTTLGSGNGNGITYINNGDGAYTLSGTCTNTFELHFNPTLKLPYGKYKLLGTPAFQKTNNGEWIATLGSGDVFEVSESKPVLDVLAYISSGSVINKTIKPMVTANLNATVDDFVPYTGDGDTLSADVAKVNERTSLNLRLTLEQGDLDEGGIPVSSTQYKRTINYIKVKPNTEYTISRSSTFNLYVVGFQAKGIAITDGTKTNNKFIVYESTQTKVSFTTTNTTQYIKVVVKNLDLSEKITIDASNSIGETVSDNTNNIGDINSNMSDYGLNNVFDGEFLQGGMDSGTIVVKDDYVITKNKIYCSSGDFIKSFGNSLESSYACFYKSDNTYIGGLNALDGCTAPSDSAYCYVEFKRSGITPPTAGHIGVYVNNQIDVVRNDVDDLKNDVDRITYDCGRASFGGSAATITQGGATWYAYGVGVLFAKEYNSVPGVQLTVIVPAGTLAIANLTNVTTTGFEATIWSLTELNGGTLEYMISKE